MGARGRWTVDPHGEVDPVFVQERFQRGLVHQGMVFEHRMQAEYLDLVVCEELDDFFRLRQAMRDARRAQHLERVDRDYLAAQGGKAQRAARVAPGRDVQFGRGGKQRLGPGAHWARSFTWGKSTGTAKATFT
jgi:hypothetical protein